MNDDNMIFIKRLHRPDLRSPLMGDGKESALDGLAIVLPIDYVLHAKDCSGDKNDKSDKKKEIGKDDKGSRGAANAPGGPVTDIALHTMLESPDAYKLSDMADKTFFA